jgi:hypothetical protein
MNKASSIDGVLVQWGDRLFYPGNRMVRSSTPNLRTPRRPQSADAIRRRIEATVRRVPQVMVKVTGGGRGIKAIAAHFRYISKNGRLEIEDENGTQLQGRSAVHELAEDWRFGGSYIGDEGPRREAFNIMLSMPRGTDAQIVLRAAREFAREELAEHKYVMVLHEHQANPHVHLSVRAESRQGRRLNPRKADLHRWREVFAEKLRGWGIEAEATHQATRGATRNHPDLWRVKAEADGRLLKPRSDHRRGAAVATSRAEARRAWQAIATALAQSGDAADRKLAASIDRFSREMVQPGEREPMARTHIEPSSPTVDGRAR